ncbi:MAG TPA: hypothetical protein VIY90_04950 [Steroidobacteraceae bacterium]
MSHSALRACSLLLAGLLLRPVHAADGFFENDAQTPSPISDFFALRASFFHANASTELRLDPPGDPLGGTALSGTRDLGFKPSENDGMAELMFRLRERNRIRADFLELDQSGSTPVQLPFVQFGNQVFNRGDVVNASLQWRIMGLTWTYAIIQNDRFELGAGVGVHAMDLDVRGGVAARFASYETSVAAAVPTPAIETAWRITRRISLTARGEYLRARINGTFGSLGDFHADAQFRWVPNFSIGAGYSLMRLKLDSLTQSDPGLVGIRLRGPEIFLRASF